MGNVMKPSVSCAGYKASQVHNQRGKLFEPPSAQRYSMAMVCPSHRAALAQWQRRQGPDSQPRSGLEPLAADEDSATLHVAVRPTP
jgi:hypothetical protein